MSEQSGQSKDLSGSSVGRFRIRERLGSGGMGEVYLAEDPQLRRTVAIKRMSARFGEDERYRQRFLREAQMASRLNDPRIAAVYDVFEREGEIFLVMERVEGETLRQRVKEPMKLDEFLPIAIECAEALGVAHAEGVLHRDIKPDNIMVTPSGRVKILDFGLAHGLSSGEETVAFETEPGMVSGTPGYVAPEVLVGGEADERSDIFSLGVVFYEALTSYHPFRAKTHIATSSRVLHEIPALPSSVNSAVPPDLDRIVMRMLGKDPAKRYQKANEVARELTWIERSGTMPTVAVAAGFKPKRARRPGRRRFMMGVAAVAAVAAVAFALIVAIPQVRRTVAGWMGAAPGEGAGAVSPAEKQLAVLPFTVLGGTAAEQAFATGLTDTVTARLSRLSATHALAVVPASSVFADKVDSADAARRHYGVNLVLTGSLQQAGNEIRVNYALVDARTQRQLNAETKTVPARNPFAVEDDVAAGVLKMLQVQLAPDERKTFEAKGTDKPDAYAFYLQGKGYLEGYTKAENIASAISVFQRALEIDPNYARAYAGLGMAYWYRYSLTQDAKWTTSSREACDRGLAINPNLAVAHVCLGMVNSGTGKYQEAVAQFQKALAEQPTNDDAYRDLAQAYQKLGRTDQAEQTYQKAIRLRPQYWAGYSYLGVFYERHGRYADAARQFEQVVALAPDSFMGYSNLGAVYFLAGDFAKALKPFEKSIEIRPNGSAYTNLGTTYFYLRRYSEAVANFEKATQLQPRDYTIWRNLGDGYYWARGTRAQAGAAYQKAIKLAEDALRVNPKSSDAYMILSACRAMTGASQQAVAAIGRALALTPDNPDVMYTAAVVYAQMGRSQDAIAWLKKALKAGSSAAMARNEPAFDSLHGMKDFPRN